MPKRARYANRVDLLQGTLDLIILQTLQWGPQHGYAISQAINASSHDAFKVETGSLYPAPHRLEKRGHVRASWGTTEHKQRARIYQLTAAGRKQLSAEQSRWSQLVAAMASLMKPRRTEA
jgi:PadR family transcriptional regulator PadR